MRSFIASALIIAGVLIAQQWVVKSSEANSALGTFVAPYSQAANAGYAAWLSGPH
ncbi:MAG: hypothetical protein P4M09_16230 [Devosia sp.]|nr:hypothetical protein [Devosia sp.]